MFAIVTRGPGGPEVFEASRHPPPVPDPGQALIDVHAAGVNFLDVYQRRAGIGPVLGNEGAGVVRALGPGVGDDEHVRLGSRVAWVLTRGAYAEQAVVDVADLVTVPDALELSAVAAVLLQGLTAHYLAHDAYAIRPGDAILVHSAAGGVGQLLTQYARARGAALVIGTVSTAAKAPVARAAGAQEVIVREDEDFAAAALRLTGDEGVHAVFDGIGIATYEGGLEALRRRGTLVLFGQASGQPGPIDPKRLATGGSLYVTQTALGAFVATRDELLARSGALFDDLVAGTIAPAPPRRYALADAADAHRALEGSTTTGKLILVPDGRG